MKILKKPSLIGLKRRRVKKAALLYGPPGVGKTTLVHAAANDFNLEVIEANASDVRTSNAIRKKLVRAIFEKSLLGYRGKIVLLDEVDGISLSEDRGGLNAIIELINLSKYPVVLTANDPWDPKLRELRNLCLLIEFKKLRQREIVQVLKKICEKEGIKADYKVLSMLAKRSKGDLRAAINDLQAIAEGKKIITLRDLEGLGNRIPQQNMFEIVRAILTARTALQAKSVLMQPNLDYEMLFQWINENIPYQYEGNIEAIAEAYDALSKADIYMGRIKRKQEWTLLPYALDLLTAGVAAIPHKPPFKFVKYSFPQKIKLLSSTKEIREVRESILKSIAKKCHTSRRIASIEYLPYLIIMFESNPEHTKKILKWLNIPVKLFERIITNR